MMKKPHLIAIGIALAVPSLLLAGCSAVSGNATATAQSTAAATNASTVSTVDGLKSASWGTNVSVTFSNGSMTFVSNGVPNHSRQAEYAVPVGNVIVPDAATAVAAADPTTAQNYSFTITTSPVLAATPTSTSLGTIGLMISGAALYNPYEGDNSTVAVASNFTILDSAGKSVAFLDTCNGHPTPMGTYHYHALPTCITSTVDTAGGPSHIIGVALDGFPIYGDRALDGTQLTAANLDKCSGIFSATPEFPNGIYHYVLLNTADSSSSIRCFSGVVDPALISQAGAGMPGMGAGMPGMGAGPAKKP